MPTFMVGATRTCTLMDRGSFVSEKPIQMDQIGEVEDADQAN